MRTDFSVSLDVAHDHDGWAPAIPRVASDCIKLLTVWVASVAPAVVATRFQYTWSLLIFIAPLALTSRDLHHRGLLVALARPLSWSLAALVPMGAVLTVGLADDFFIYPATDAVLGITFPAVDLGGVDHAFQIPVEELAFYVLGFASLLMLYAWADAALLPTSRSRGVRVVPTVGELATAVAISAALAVTGWALQRTLNPTASAPGYWLYLMLVPMPVVLAVGPRVASRINWPALALVCLALWGHSVLWEVTLAIPQGWWGYQAHSMIGLEVAAWHHLPFEAVVVWLLTPIATVISFEALRARLAQPTRSHS